MCNIVIWLTFFLPTIEIHVFPAHISQTCCSNMNKSISACVRSSFINCKTWSKILKYWANIGIQWQKRNGINKESICELENFTFGAEKEKFKWVIHIFCLFSWIKEIYIKSYHDTFYMLYTKCNTLIHLPYTIMCKKISHSSPRIIKFATSHATEHSKQSTQKKL